MKQFIVILITILLVPMAANANVAPSLFVPKANIADQHLDDRMIINKVSWDSDNNIFNVFEQIGIHSNHNNSSPVLIKSANYYTSSAAIVTERSSKNNYFDSLVTWGLEEATYNSNIMKINFYVLNDSLFSWSDFHFEFLSYNNFSDLDLYVKNASNTSNDFNISDFNSPGQYSSINFGLNTSNLLTNGETTIFEFKFDLSKFDHVINGSDGFIIRQVATTSNTPIPGALILFGSGLLYLAGIKRK